MKASNDKQVGFELAELVAAASDALVSILTDANRLEKHGTYTWLKENLTEHLLKGSRHAITHSLIKTTMQEEDEENHIDLAITRLLMAKALELREKE